MSEVYRVTAVIDDHTCDYCRRLHGTSITREEVVAGGGFDYGRCTNDLNGCRCVCTLIEEDTMTDTFATLEISRAAFDEIVSRLRKAGRQIYIRGESRILLNEVALMRENKEEPDEWISGVQLKDLENNWRKRGYRIRRGDLLLVLEGKKDKLEASAAAFEQCADELHALLLGPEDE